MDDLLNCSAQVSANNSSGNHYSKIFADSPISVSSFMGKYYDKICLEFGYQNPKQDPDSLKSGSQCCQIWLFVVSIFKYLFGPLHF